MKPLAPRILIIDDDSINCVLIQLLLQFPNPEYEITCVLTSREGLSLAATQRFDLYVLDYRLGATGGTEICRAIRRTHADARIMFFTGEARERERQEAIKAGADAYLIKPDDLKILPEIVKRLMGTHQPAVRPSASLQSQRSRISL
jgi:two-component system response regulator ArlR